MPPPRVTHMSSDDGLAQLYQRVCPPLTGLLTVLGGSRPDAEEIAHDAFVKLVMNWPRVAAYDDPAAWVRTVAVRLLISRQRRRQVAQRGLQRLRRVAPGDQGQEATATADGAIDMARALAALPLDQRTVLVLHHAADLPVEQIAADLGLPVGTVKSRLARARAAIAPLVDDHLEGMTDHA